jgi:hypothetical protein
VSKFADLKVANEQLRAHKAAQEALILDRQEKSHIFMYTGDFLSKRRCNEEPVGLQNQLKGIEDQITSSETEGRSVADRVLEVDVRLKDLETQIQEVHREMEQRRGQQQERLAALHQAHVEQQQHQQNEMQNHFVGINMGPVHPNGGPIHPNGGPVHHNEPPDVYAHGPGEGSYGADHLAREEHRRQRREAGAPYRNNGRDRDREQRPLSQGNNRDNRVNRGTQPANRGRGRGHTGVRLGWAEHGHGSQGPIERGEASMPMTGNWLRGNEDGMVTGQFGQAMPPPPPPPGLMPPDAEFQGFPGGPFEPPPSFF